jgi:hypothetical protein
MNRFTKGLALALTIFGFSTTNTFAQKTATATAYATVVTPIAISRTADLNFGIFASGSTLGTVVVPISGPRTKTGGVVLPAGIITTVNPAGFTVTGQPSYNYSISFPSSTNTLSNGTTTMTLDTFVHSAGTTPQLNSSGTQSFTVGATLNVAADQAAGDYVSQTPFVVQVVYN